MFDAEGVEKKEVVSLRRSPKRASAIFLRAALNDHDGRRSFSFFESNADVHRNTQCNRSHD